MTKYIVECLQVDGSPIDQCWYTVRRGSHDVYGATSKYYAEHLADVLNGYADPLDTEEAQEIARIASGL